MYRIIVIDDEELIRQGVAGMIGRYCSEWEVAGTAGDGKEALELAEQMLPDAVITDICMPHVNGLDFLENLHTAFPDIKLLALSGYDEFDYAVQAFRSGVSDYLLKPLEKEKLVASLDKIARELDSRAQERHRIELLNRQSDKTNSLYLEQYFTAALRGTKLPALPPSAEELANANSFCCILYDTPQWNQALLETLFHQRMQPVQHITFFSIGNPVKHAAVLWTVETYRPEWFLEVHHRLSSVAAQYRRVENVPIHFFVGEMTDSPAKLRNSYRQSLWASTYAFPEECEAISTYRDVMENSLGLCPTMPDDLAVRVKELPSAVRYQNMAVYGQTADGIFAWFREIGIRDAAFRRMYILGLCFLILNASDDISKMSYFEFANIQQEIMAAQSLDELRMLLDNFVRLSWLRKEQDKPMAASLASRVEAIVEERLADCDFSLDEVAAALFISPNYLRQLFKQETGQTFTEFLTVHRMKRASILLGNPQIRIGDVAELCGYADSRYFSACFKKHWSMTPSEYQASVVKE